MTVLGGNGLTPEARNASNLFNQMDLTKSNRFNNCHGVLDTDKKHLLCEHHVSS